MTETIILKTTENGVVFEDGTPMNYGQFLEKFGAGATLTVTGEVGEAAEPLPQSGPGTSSSNNELTQAAQDDERVSEKSGEEAEEATKPDSEGTENTSVQNEGGYGTEETKPEDGVSQAAQ